jgi:hypothetical protein
MRTHVWSRAARVAVCLGLLTLTVPTASADIAAAPVIAAAPIAQADEAPSPANLGKARCQLGDRPETGLQGRVPPADRVSGRAVLGYTCNLKVVGGFASASFANFDSYKNCVYYTDNRGGSGSIIGQGNPADGGGVVLDVSNPTHPVKTAYLTAWAMKDAGESLRVNIKRGLLVADYYTNVINPEAPARSLAVYDVSKDCRHPRLLADIKSMPHAIGHEGCFEPDGMAYYMASASSTITPIDLRDPAHPREMSDPWPLAVHGCSISDDGKRGYFEVPAARTNSTNGEMVIADTSTVQAGAAHPQLKIVGTLPSPYEIEQSSYPLNYGGHPYLFDWSEALPAGRTCAATVPSTFGYARILDLADERHPREVSRLINEVQDAANCALVTGDTSTQTQGMAEGDSFWSSAGAALFLYDTHYCRPDRLHDPTIMACAQFGSGLRVYDIRNPYHAREIAYYNTGMASDSNRSLDFAVSPPVIRRDLGQIWWVTLYRGFHAAKFEAGTWPFKGSSACTKTYDEFAAHYDLHYSACPAARRAGASKPSTREPGALHPSASQPLRPDGSTTTKRSARMGAGPSASVAVLSPSASRESLTHRGLPPALMLAALAALLYAASVRALIRQQRQRRPE